MSRDLVQIRHRRLGLVRGYEVLDKRRGRAAVTHEGKQVSVKAQNAVLLARNPGYRVSDERLTVGLNVQSGVLSVRAPVFVQSRL